MKKAVLLLSVLFFQLAPGMSTLQKHARAFLEHHTANYYYGFAPENEWIVKAVVECTDHNHQSCTLMRRYFENYVPILCQRDPYYATQPKICSFLYEALVDQQFVQGLMRDHYTTEVEAKFCAKKLAEVLDNTQSVN